MTPRLDRVVLVLDVADDLLDDVLEGHDAAQRAVFVDHDGEVLVALRGTPASWSNSTVDSGMNQGGVMTSSILTVRRPAGGAHRAEQVLGVHHADMLSGWPR